MTTETNDTREPQALREAYDNQSKAFDKLKGEMADLQAQHRSLLAQTTFEKAKLNPKHAELFLKVNGDNPITSEAAVQFANEYGLATVSSEGASAEETKPAADTGLSSMSTAGTQGNSAGNAVNAGPKLSQSEFQKLLSNDKAAALKAYTEGRVEHAAGNQAADDLVRKGVIVQ